MKITKRKFELMLFEMNNEEQLGTNHIMEHGEEQGDYTLVHLYYNDNGHCGTWCKGKGFVFENKFGGEA